MSHRRSRAATRAWSLLRLALLWGRRGGVLKCRLLAELRHVSDVLKALNRHSSVSRRRLDTVRYGERQLSFDETPIFRIGMIRPASLRFKMPSIIPCIKPPVHDFECDLSDDEAICGMRSTFTENECDFSDEDDDDEEEVSGIDEKADEFIARFYQQMKLQRQVSYIEYEEMLIRGAS